MILGSDSLFLASAFVSALVVLFSLWKWSNSHSSIFTDRLLHRENVQSRVGVILIRWSPNVANINLNSPKNWNPRVNEHASPSGELLAEQRFFRACPTKCWKIIPGNVTRREGNVTYDSVQEPASGYVFKEILGCGTNACYFKVRLI